MSVEAFISFGNELPIESLFAAPGPVAPTQNDAFAFRVEGERESPNTIRRIEAQFFMFAWREPFNVSTRGHPS